MNAPEQPDSLAALCRDVAVHCAEAVGDTGTEAIAALSSAGTALRAAAAALTLATPTAVGRTPRETGMRISDALYDRLMRIARRWSGYSDAGRAEAARLGPAPWLETDLDLLCETLGVPLRMDGVRRGDDYGAATKEAREARHAHAVHVTTQAWRIAGSGERGAIHRASPALHHALSMMDRESPD